VPARLFLCPKSSETSAVEGKVLAVKVSFSCVFMTAVGVVAAEIVRAVAGAVRCGRSAAGGGAATGPGTANSCVA